MDRLTECICGHCRDAFYALNWIHNPHNLPICIKESYWIYEAVKGIVVSRHKGSALLLEQDKLVQVFYFVPIKNGTGVYSFGMNERSGIAIATAIAGLKGII